MSGRRKPNSGDEGEAGTRLLNTLVRRRLLVSVKAGQGNVETNLLNFVAALIACRADQVLPAIEDDLYKQKGMDRGDVD